jgi:hypothetical protein
MKSFLYMGVFSLFLHGETPFKDGLSTPHVIDVLHHLHIPRILDCGGCRRQVQMGEGAFFFLVLLHLIFLPYLTSLLFLLFSTGLECV